jgi:hypothetical protein
VNPAAVMTSFTGVVAVILIFAIPIIGIIATLAIVLGALKYRHRQRMKMIEQGMMPAPPKARKGNWYALLITGSILLAFGFGMFMVGVLTDEGEMEPGLVFGCVGLAMLVCFIVIRALNRTRREATPRAVDADTTALQ